MSDTTPIYGFPFPEGTDPPNGATQIEALAQEIEDQLAAGSGLRSRGKAIISAEQGTASSSYTLLGTPDRVENLVLPTDGLIFVNYRALAGGSLSGKAALFLNDNQVLIPALGQAPGAAEVAIQSNYYGWLQTDTGPVDGLGNRPGLIYSGGANGTVDGGGTGLNLTGVAVLEANAGTYSVSVRFKTASGNLFAKDRKLRAWTQAFG